MGSAKKLSISFSSKEVIFSFFVLLAASLIIFGIGIYVGIGLHEKTPVVAEEQKELVSETPKTESLENKLQVEAEKPTDAVVESPPPIEPPLTGEKPPQELPKKLLAEELEPTLPKTTSLFVSDENLKTLADILKSGTYTLKLGTYAKIEEAITLKDKIKNDGFPAVYYCPQEDASTVSVCLGGFSDEEKAKEARLLKDFDDISNSIGREMEYIEKIGEEMITTCGLGPNGCEGGCSQVSYSSSNS